MNLLRTSIEFANRIFGQMRAGRRMAVPNDFDYVRLNLGCGLSVTKGWINIDGSINALVASMPSIFHKPMYRLSGSKQYFSEEEYCRFLRDHLFIHHDLATGIPFNNDVADYIFSSHFIEHLYRNDALNLLKECYRVLKEGGVLRISIPDLKYAISLYDSGKKDEMLLNYFFLESGGSHYSSHKYMYDFEMLSKLLKGIGFFEINRCEYQKGALPDSHVLDNQPEVSLYVEARK